MKLFCTSIVFKVRDFPRIVAYVLHTRKLHLFFVEFSLLFWEKRTETTGGGLLDWRSRCKLLFRLSSPAALAPPTVRFGSSALPAGVQEVVKLGAALQ